MKKYLVYLFAVIILAGCGQAQPAAPSTPAVSTEPVAITSTPTVQPSVTPAFVLTPMSSELPTAEAYFDGVRVTYVGNSGFLITAGDNKILIDALFDGFGGIYYLPDDVYTLLVDAQPPFDNIDLILITHDHGDHFSADPVRQYMQTNPTVVLVSNEQVTSQLAEFGDRVITLNATDGNPDFVEVGNIQVEGIYLSHGAVPTGEIEIINYGYIVTVNDVSFFHTGDMDGDMYSDSDLRAYGLPEMDLDFAFITHFLLSTPYTNSLINTGIDSRYIIASHYQYTEAPDPVRIQQFFRGTVFFDSEMESWVMP
ncbi:MAG TPA: MBL fold metallo-hydrolase [Longilinea sp.]|nr:MBL fold metallo-hydrolase [Longilinea sp.]